MADSGPSHEVRLMALEILAAHLLTIAYRATSDSAQIRNQRQRFRWFFESNKIAIGDSLLHAVYPEEVQLSVDQIFAFAEVLAQRRDLT